MAMVYLADDLKHERKVALKVLKPELGERIDRDHQLPVDEAEEVQELGT